MGQVIHLVWAYELISLDFLNSFSRAGWLVDDVAVAVSGTAPTTLRVTNNLSQATWSLDGPLTESGAGLDTTFSNAPPGEYTVTFNPVPFHITPEPQTATLIPGDPLLLSGLYTIEDSTGNSLPDSWEEQFFGPDVVVDANADSDGDGLSDGEEFMAGTDPTLEESRLELDPLQLNPDDSVTLNWSASPGHAYRIEGTADLETWLPLTDWIRATDDSETFTLAPDPDRPLQFVRVSVRP
jgi:hypothetical protein